MNEAQEKRLEAIVARFEEGILQGAAQNKRVEALTTRLEGGILRNDRHLERFEAGVRSLANTKTELAAIVHRQNKFDAWAKVAQGWINWLREQFDLTRSGMSRPQMPSLLDPEDTGNIEIGAFGARAAFTGKVPVRIAFVLLAFLAIVGTVIGSEYAFHQIANASPTAPTPAVPASSIPGR